MGNCIWNVDSLYKKTAPQVLNGEQSTDLTHLVNWYKESKQFLIRILILKTAQLEVVALQNGNPASRKAWEIICSISEKAYQEIYDLLDVKIHTRGESFYNDLLPGIVKELEEKDL